MRNKRWLRAGLASLTVCGLALSAFVVACGDDDTGGGGIVPGTDSGSDTGKADTGAADTGTDTGTDAGGDADAAPPVIPAKLQLINAAIDFGPTDPVGALRICYKVGPDADHLIWATLPPLPNRKSSDAQPFPGLFAGTGGPVDGTGVSLEGLVVKPYLLSAFSLQQHGLGNGVTPDNEKDCQSIIEKDAGGGFEENKDYWVLPNIPAGTFKNKNSYLLALTGCVGNSEQDGGHCPGAPSGTAGPGNLSINIFQIDNTTVVPADKLGLQFVNVSPNLEGALQVQSGGTLHTRPAIQPDKTVSSGAKLIGAIDGGTPGDVPPGTLTTVVQLTGVNNQSDFVMANPNVADISFTLPQVANLSFGLADGGFYSNGKSFTIVALGDIATNQLNDAGAGNPPTFNTKFFHFLALPNDPTVKQFDPSK